MYFYFLYSFVLNISHSKKNCGRYDQKYIFALHAKYTLFLSDFSETWIFLISFTKILKSKFYENLSIWGRIDPCPRGYWRTDRHDEANSRFSRLWERTKSDWTITVYKRDTTLFMRSTQISRTHCAQLVAQETATWLWEVNKKTLSIFNGLWYSWIRAS